MIKASKLKISKVKIKRHLSQEEKDKRQAQTKRFES
jgi:hypothetical protein